MLVTRFSPAWTRGDAAVFSSIIGHSFARPVDHENPVHKARVERYELNIEYYQQAQYHSENQHALRNRDFLSLRVNYSGICTRSVETKADWLFGEPIIINVVEIDESGEVIKPGDPEATKHIKAKIKQVREYNRSDFWDWVMACMGLVCGDYFVLVDAVENDTFPQVSLLDPSYVFPDYPNDINKPMRACQMQYEIEPSGDPVDDEDGSMSAMRIVEDYRLELAAATGPDTLEDLEVLSEELLDEYKRARENEAIIEDIEQRVTCVYRKFINGELVPGSKRDIGIPAIPIIHGLNMYAWNQRYGNDEISKLIPKLEKYNEMYYYAERVGRTNAHAKLWVSGIRPGESPMRADFDDVIYGGEGTDAKVITLPTDTSVLEFVTSALETEMHRDACIPPIASGEAEGGFGTPSGLALIIRYGPLLNLTRRHRVTYGQALQDQYHLVLMFDEMVIDGGAYGSKYQYDTFKFEFSWYESLPKAVREIIDDMVTATGGDKQIISLRTAREQIPWVDPDEEEARIKEEAVNAMSLAREIGPPPGLGGPPDTGGGPPGAPPPRASDSFATTPGPPGVPGPPVVKEQVKPPGGF